MIPDMINIKKIRIENQITFLRLTENIMKCKLRVTTTISIKYTRLNINKCFRGMATYENNPHKLLTENNIPKIMANMKTSFIGGFILNILKKRYPINTVSNKKLKYPTGIKSDKFLSDLNAAMFSFHNDENIEA